jgi:heptaprenyl diphosphate synthase
MSAKTIARMALLSSIMLVLSYVERQIPGVFGALGIKLGLANTVLLYAIFLMPPASAWVLMLVKVGIAGLIYLNGLAMLFSLAGGTLSLLVMFLARRLPGVSIVGVSIAGALAHNIGQMAVAALTVGTGALVAILPWLIGVGTLMGFVTGVIARYVNQALEKAGYNR